jgi:hypothetical protein
MLMEILDAAMGQLQGGLKLLGSSLPGVLQLFWCHGQRLWPETVKAFGVVNKGLIPFSPYGLEDLLHRLHSLFLATCTGAMRKPFKLTLGLMWITNTSHQACGCLGPGLAALRQNLKFEI